MPAPQLSYPTIRYHQSGRTMTVRSPEAEPKGPEWAEKPWPLKPAAAETDVNAMPPDQAIAHLKDRVSEMEGEIRNLKAEKDWQARQFDRSYGDLKARCDAAEKQLAESHPAPEAEAPAPAKAKGK